MKVKLTENNKHFVDTLSAEDRAKVTVTESTIESSDEHMHDKLLAYHRARLAEIGARLKAETEQFKMEHPEYFE